MQHHREDDEEQQEDDGKHQEGEDENQLLLRPLNALSLQETQPGRDWKSLYGCSWEHVMPMAELQLVLPLPRDPSYPEDTKKTSWKGACSLHSFAEVLTATLRLVFSEDVGFSFDVDQVAMLVSAAGHGALHIGGGASVAGISDLLDVSGFPLDASTVPPRLLSGGAAPGPHQRAYVKGLSIYMDLAVSLPCTQDPWTEEGIMEGLSCPSTHDQFERAMKYRERLCRIVDMFGPISLSLNLQSHYFKRRPTDEPYRLLPDGEPLMIRLPSRDIEPVGHAVTAYGYKCPGGDVRTLRLLYQENAKGAPDDDKADRHSMDPDAIKAFFFPVFKTDDLRFVLH